MKEKKHRITHVQHGSIGEELELEPGDLLLSINGSPVEDIFDYQYLLNDEYVVLLVEKSDGEQWELEVEKEYEEDLGLEFGGGLMDDYRSCSNNCIFCFIDQMPPGMRDTLYFKDDDSRLSFLQGNYVTLTNMSDHDIDRIIQYHLEPINISFQAMDPQLRCQMLHNRFAGKSLEKVDKLYEAGIVMNGQIVLCKGINDGEQLEYSLEQLAKYAPLLESVSVVPVGLTKYREGLYPLEPFQKEDACRVLDQIEAWQKKMRSKYGMNFVHASDEWYIMAQRELPGEESYDGYLQLENGVGMLTLLKDETEAALSAAAGDDRHRTVTLATGFLAAPYLEKLLQRIQEKFPGIRHQVYAIRNDFFGEQITVAGLITGQDLISQLSGRDLGEELLLPCCMLRSGEDVFLDDLTVKELEQKLQVPIRIVDSAGEDFVNAVLGNGSGGNKKRRQMYEQTDRSDCGQA